MHDQRNLTQDAVLRAQIAMANRLIAEQSATIARAHSAIERAMETLRGPDGERSTGGLGTIEQQLHAAQSIPRSFPSAPMLGTDGWRTCRRARTSRIGGLRKTNGKRHL
jgi:hypothetical protein